MADRARYLDARVALLSRRTLDGHWPSTPHSSSAPERGRPAPAHDRDEPRTNDQVKKISSWAAIRFAPTLVAGIYGMNFRNMPELDWPWGYPFAIALMAAVSAGLYVVFKKNDWL
ncbi:MAG: CorA family divalent cation transporter [Microbacterium sp.]